jgi:DNA-binding MarR family transcriptional regulator
LKKSDDAAAAELHELAAKLRMALAQVTRAQRQEVTGRLTAVQLSALCKVELHGPLRLGALASREQVAGSTMSRVVASLELAGLIQRRTDPSSARCSLVTITRAGRRQIEEVRRDRTDLMTCRLAKLGAAHQRALAAAVPALEALVESVTPGAPPSERARRLRG